MLSDWGYDLSMTDRNKVHIKINVEIEVFRKERS